MIVGRGIFLATDTLLLVIATCYTTYVLMYIVLILVLKKRPSQETRRESLLQQRPPIKSHLHAVHVVVKQYCIHKRQRSTNSKSRKKEKNTDSLDQINQMPSTGQIKKSVEKCKINFLDQRFISS